MLEYEISLMVTYAGILVLTFVAGTLLKWPLKVVSKIVINALLGGAVILGVNLIAGSAAAGGVIVPLNLVTAAIAGTLGLPGALLLIVIYVLKL